MTDFSDKSDVGLDTIIFDVDGTLLDLTHRRHFVTGGRKDWGKFFDEMVHDSPLVDVCLLAELLGDHPLVNQGAIKLMIFSGRPETHRQQTVDLLLVHARSLVQKADRILMRAENDHRADTIVKKEFLDQIRAEGYNPRFVVDDRPSVCDMWVKNGVTCLQHINQIDEWDEPRTWDHGKLHLIVGPSGAGKSTFSKGYMHKIWKEDDILSTDAMREKITGDFEDQSANDQVFYAIRAIAAARLKAGLDTVIDGTNLRSRNRREFRDLIPADAPLGSIHYWVIDRPLAAKHKSAGWRDKVTIHHKTFGDEKLVDRHHRIFQAVKGDVLRGDNDPRVMVHDHRFTS